MRRVPAFLVAVCGAVLTALLGVAPAPAAASDDTYFDQQWNLAQIRAPEAWATSTGAGVKIGIIDTGVDAGHPDLQGKIDATANCVGGTCREGGADDGHGHGTVISGIAAAATGNGRGMAGVAPDARLVVAKAVDDEGRGDVGDILNAIRWVVDRGAKVVNLSLGDPNFLLTSLLGTPLRPGIEYAWSHNAVPVLAAGNENVGLLDLGSANYGNLNALVVGATDRAGAVAPYSSPLGSAKWGLVAPGGDGDGPGNDILSTYPGGRYAWVAGTSMAAPHVSGGLALLLAQGLGPTQAVQRLLATLDTSIACGPGCQGRLDLAAAVGSGAASSSAPGAAPGPGSLGVPPTTRPAAAAPPTTTTPPAPSTTIAPTTVPGTTASTTAEPESRALAAGPLDGGGHGGSSRNPAVLVLAVALVGGVGMAAGLVGWERVRGAGGS